MQLFVTNIIFILCIAYSAAEVHPKFFRDRYICIPGLQKIQLQNT